MSLFLTLSFVAFIWYAMFRMPYWRWSGCACGREKLPWFGLRHEKQPIMWVMAGFMAAYAVNAALFHGPIWTIFAGIVAVWTARSAWEHGKGKRKWPKRAAGLVRINRHGRLVVTPE